MSTVLDVDSPTATEMIAAGRGITLVDFTAEWCPPCRAVAPVLARLAAEVDDLVVLTVDVDASPELSAEFGVMSFPTLMFFVAGRPVHRIVGSRSIGSLRQELEQARSAATESRGVTTG